ncbi:DUF1997 domain-containing protein [Umezakia ovalisporum]|jgi:hypothetical protein|uniref:DUF1997 domain-containing protein n=2 Tax=Umezakia ovalisporum TaxID=75695 RepID=A0AA43GZE1_9CYAN|nr:DUF1997 domain-containing protein [Umezakia ovalisporum]MBI1240060.1 DUF1997 domain-containing protein [Nostoc sp. RI_552]MDH6056972.1 DUF1997 domain-containing protein [Umezakia ovalisporum FSS-43]MDH6064462.1 DUF1997 domain-containing protein [Umezakia ovalisporum FSS-62]MDH6068422.1 DUF1997 domain-containing protein [Umezakia ovalisporum APH033B]MDH6071163.1 DUF1997 domain-containing protein [Umezakia ovalisporum CobakiLakeA]
MATEFTASQTVKINIPPQPIPIQHYLRQPQRLVHALTDSSRIHQLSEEVFRLKMRPLVFMSLNIQPTVDLRVWAESNSTIKLQSLGCEILGFEYINQRFALNLQGNLSLHDNSNTITILQGRADLEVQVDIPPPLSFTPKPILEATGNGLLKSILITIKQRLLHQLLADYRSWVTLQISENPLLYKSAELPFLNFDS